MGHLPRRWTIATVGLLGVVACVRLAPYLAPIDVSKLNQDDRSLTLRDRNGQLLGTLLTQTSDRTATVPLDDISPHFIQAMLTVEDADFYHRGPVDIPALIRATYQWGRHGRVVSGGSTISMQLARLLRPAPRTVPTKLREIWRAWRIAAGSSQDEILHAYLNRLPMGGNIYGVEAAAWMYFGVSASELTLSQASLLAAIPNNPNHYNPYRNLEALQQRQTFTIDRMVAEGYISQRQANRAYSETLSFQDPQYGIAAAPHFVFWVASQLPPGAGSDIRTTLDRSLQAFVEGQVQQTVRALADRNVHQAAAIAIDNATGEVLAYVGSPNYFSGQDAAQFDGVQALRQPGSTLKPFLYEQAIASRLLRPNAVLPDVPSYYSLGNAQIYRPVDFDRTFQGPVRVRLALANSLNIPAIAVLEDVGTEQFLDHLHQLGFEQLDRSANHYGLGLALGAGEVSLWELARAYSTMARLGDRAQLQVLAGDGAERGLVNGRDVATSQREIDPAEAALTEAKGYEQLLAGGTELGDADVWALMANMLSDRYARGIAFGVDSVLNLPFPAAVKTGTSSGFRDTWTVGFTPEYTVATWVGNFDGSAMRDISGVDGAAPLWQRILLHLHQESEPSAFSPPQQMERVPVCALSGLKPTELCPSVTSEYVFIDELASYEQQPDTFYQQVGERVQVNLPPEYDEWLASYGQALLDTSSLRIVSPRDGERYVLYPDTPLAPTGSQHIEFQVSQSSHDSLWTLNDRPLETPAGNSVFWPMQPGTWTLEVRRGENRDRVTFSVESKQSNSPAVGFTIGSQEAATPGSN